MGHLPGAKKIIFLIRDIDGPTPCGRVGGILSIRGPEVSLGPLWGVSGRVQSAYAAYAAASKVRYISHGPLRYLSIGHDLPKISIQSSLGSSKRAHAA